MKIDKHQLLEVPEIDERQPALSDDLVCHFPFDCTPDGISHMNRDDSKNVWVAGTSGSAGFFTQQGDTSENERILSDNPFNVQDVVWHSVNQDVDTGHDGGFHTHVRPIDPTKMYRISVWIKRYSTVGYTARSYLGLQQNTVMSLTGTEPNSNPYIVHRTVSETTELAENWVLFVGYVYPHDTTETVNHPDGGIWSIDGRKLVNGTSFKWVTGQTVSGLRTYFYSSTVIGEECFWWNPVFEIYEDGVSATIEEVLQGNHKLMHPVQNSDCDLSMHLGQGNIVTNVLGADSELVSGGSRTLDYAWDIDKHQDALRIYGWSAGYNSGVASPEIGYHAKYTQEGPNHENCIKFIDRNEELGLGHRWLGVTDSITGNMSAIGWSAGTTLTVSWMQKVDAVGKPVYVGLYHKENAVSTFGDTLKSYYCNDVNVWEYKTFTYTIPAEWDATTSINLYFYGHYGGIVGTAWVYKPQVIVDSSPRAYAAGTRSSSSLFEINVPEKPQDWTIIFKWFPLTSSKNNDSYVSTANQSSIVAAIDPDGFAAGSAIIRNYLSSGINASLFIDCNGTFGSSHFHATYEVDNLKESWCVLRKSGTALQFKMFQDGWKPQHSGTIPNSIALGGVYFGATPIWDSHVSDLSVYRTYLDDSALDGIVQQKLALQDVQLTGEVDDNVNPNLWGNPDLATTTYNVHSAGGTITKETDDLGTYHKGVITNSSFYRGYDIPTEDGAEYIFDGWFYVVSGNSFTYRPLAIEGSLGATYLYGSISQMPVDQWVYAWARCTADSNVRCLIYPTTGASPGSGTLLWRNISFRKINEHHSSLNSSLKVGELHEIS